MSTLRTILALTAVLALTQTVQAQQGYPVRFDFGTTPTPQELAELFAIPPDGRGLPSCRAIQQPASAATS